MSTVHTIAAIGIAFCLPAASAQPLAWLWDEARLPTWSAAEAAVLQRHILLSGDSVMTRPRMRRAALRQGTLVTPVVHVEVSILRPPQNIESSRPAILLAMRQAAAGSTSGWVQLDMEARPSQRLFYRSLVRELRATLPPDIKLSVTALAWWCRSPEWLDELPADEVVPMFFRMGKDSAALRELVDAAPATLHPRCRSSSAGFSPQEPFPASTVARYGRSYWFDYHAWRSSFFMPPPGKPP
jgi:hypothetical protein